MPRDGLNFDHLKKEYVICICEGAAEQAIIELLLDHNSLVFAHDNLVGREVTRKRKSSEIQSSFLNRAYQRRVNILRILDSKRIPSNSHPSMQNAILCITSTHAQKLRCC